MIGSEAKTKLFSGGWALGETIRLNGDAVHHHRRAAAQDAGEATTTCNRQIYIPFNTMSDLKDTKYLDGIWFNYRGDNELAEKSPARDPGRGAPLPAHRITTPSTWPT